MNSQEQKSRKEIQYQNLDAASKKTLRTLLHDPAITKTLENLQAEERLVIDFPEEVMNPLQSGTGSLPEIHIWKENGQQVLSEKLTGPWKSQVDFSQIRLLGRQLVQMQQIQRLEKIHSELLEIQKDVAKMNHPFLIDRIEAVNDLIAESIRAIHSPDPWNRQIKTAQIATDLAKHSSQILESLEERIVKFESIPAEEKKRLNPRYPKGYSFRKLNEFKCIEDEYESFLKARIIMAWLYAIENDRSGSVSVLNQTREELDKIQYESVQTIAFLKNDKLYYLSWPNYDHVLNQNRTNLMEYLDGCQKLEILIRQEDLSDFTHALPAANESSSFETEEKKDKAAYPRKIAPSEYERATREDFDREIKRWSEKIIQSFAVATTAVVVKLAKKKTQE